MTGINIKPVLTKQIITCLFINFKFKNINFFLNLTIEFGNEIWFFTGNRRKF